jgi:hypothetical protein
LDFQLTLQEAKHLRYQKSRENAKIRFGIGPLGGKTPMLPFLPGKRKDKIYN